VIELHVVADGDLGRKVEAFVEKLEAATPARYLADGCLWYSGNFMFRAEVTLDASSAGSSPRSRRPPRAPSTTSPPIFARRRRRIRPCRG
jgi:hypothetical protein